MTDELQPDTLDKATLDQLNKEYIQAFMAGDVNWYRENLADDFVCIESDGTVLDKEQFLANAAKGPDVAEYKLQKVNIRLYGTAALVQATGLFVREDGSKGMSHYTDVYAKTGKEWKAVSAQVTRTSRLDTANDSE